MGRNEAVRNDTLWEFQLLSDGILELNEEMLGTFTQFSHQSLTHSHLPEHTG